MTPRLLETVRDLPKCSPYLHVPLQSGSNAVLQRMKRGYTVEEYREMMHRIWDTVPDAAVSSDFIVGFCGETAEDFEQTVAAVREFRFKNSFIFKYSPRPGTKADERLADDVPHDVKQWRNNELLAIQDAISEEDNQRFIGTDRGSAGGRSQQDLAETRGGRARHAAHRAHALRSDCGVRRHARDRSASCCRSTSPTSRPTRCSACRSSSTWARHWSSSAEPAAFSPRTCRRQRTTACFQGRHRLRRLLDARPRRV